MSLVKKSTFLKRVGQTPGQQSRSEGFANREDFVSGARAIQAQRQQETERRREEAYEQYKKAVQAAQTVQHDQESGYRRTAQIKQGKALPTVQHDQQSGYRRTAQLKAGVAQHNAQRDQVRGMGRTSEILGKQIDALDERIYNARLNQMEYQQKVDAGEAEDITSMLSRMEELEERKTSIDAQRALPLARENLSGLDKEARELLREYVGGKLDDRMTAKYKLRKMGYTNEQIARYAEYENVLQDYAVYRQKAEGARQFGQDAPVLATVVSSLEAPLKALGGVESVRGVLPKGLGGYQNENMPTNIYSPWYSATQVSSAMRSSVMQDMGPVGQFLYQTGTSALDSAVNMAVSTGIVGALGLTGEAASAAVAETMNWVVGSQVAADSVYQGIQNGKSNEQALIDGIVEGAIEGITEKYSAGEIIESMLSDDKLWKRLVRSFASEGAEEVASNWLNRIYDAAARRDKNELARSYEEKIAQGMSEEKALAAVLGEIAAEDGLSFLAGGLSGLAMSGAYEMADTTERWKNGQLTIDALSRVIDRNGAGTDADEAMRAPAPTEKDGENPAPAGEVQNAIQSAFGMYNQYAEERDARQWARPAAQSAENEGNGAAQNFADGENPVAEKLNGSRAAENPGETGAENQSAFEKYNQYAGERDARQRARAAEAQQAEARRRVYAAEERGEITHAEAEQQLDVMEQAEPEGEQGAALESDRMEARTEAAEAEATKAVQQRAQSETERAEAELSAEARASDERTIRQWAKRKGYSGELTATMVEGYTRSRGAMDAAQYAEQVGKAYEYGKSGFSQSAAQKAAQGISQDVTKAAWAAGKEQANAKATGKQSTDDGGKRDAGVDSGRPGRAVAAGTGAAGKKSAEIERAKTNIGRQNRVRDTGAPYLSGKEIGLSRGAERKSFREAPESTWDAEMKNAAETLRRAGFENVHFVVGSIGVTNQKANVTRYVDGAMVGDAVWVNAAAKKFTVTQLATHEAFHREIQDAPYLKDSVLLELTDQLGESGIQELAQKYAEAYEGCYDAEDMEAYIEEICADAYAGMDRLPDVKEKLIQKAAEQAQEAGQETEESGGQRAPPEKYSIQETSDGKRYVVVDKQQGRFTGLDNREAAKLAKDIINEEYSGQTLPLGDYATTTVRSQSNWREHKRGDRYDGASKYVYDGREYSEETFNAKMRAAANLDELLEASEYVGHGDDRKNHSFAEDGFDYYKTTFVVGGRVFEGTFNIGLSDMGATFYGMTKIEQVAVSSTLASALVTDAQPDRSDLFNDSIRTNEQKSQEKFSAAEENFEDVETAKENDQKALDYFGKTYRWSETGYLLLNGTKLDFSGRHEGASGGYRSVDHRDIVDALGEDYGGGDYSGGMVRFMQEGNIRISPESGGINLAVMPTKAQMDALSDFISKERGEVILDIDDANGQTVSSTEYPRGTHANKVLQDIRNYFQNGTAPEVNGEPTVSQFRYSAAEEAADAETQTQYTLDSIPKKAQTYLMRSLNQTAAQIQNTMSLPFAARKKVLKPALETMMNEYLQTGSISQETMDKTFEDSYEKGVELDTEFYDQYKDVKKWMQTTAVTLSEADRADIADFNAFRKEAFGRLRITNEGGTPVDTAYMELHEQAPELFPVGITHPADQLMRMFEVSRSIEKVQRSLDEYHGQNAAEFKRWAKNDYEASVEGMLGSLHVARRYAEARMRQEQSRPVPQSMEEVKALYKDLKSLRRVYERAASKTLLTEEDNRAVNRLLRGELAPEDVQGMENAQGILSVYEAKADYDAAVAKIAEWKRHRKGELRKQADALLENADKAKDKKAGILYSRETMTRNVRDIFPEADAERINKAIFEPVRAASAEANRLTNRLRDEVRAMNLSRKVEKGNLVSEAHAVQLLGEAQDNIRMLEQKPYVQERDGKTLDEWRSVVVELWETSPGLDRAKIERSVEGFRKIYDGLFEQMNDVRIRNGYEPVNYRSGYFPHFQPGTTDGILGLMGKALGIDAEVTALPTTINGLTHTFKPGITYFGHALERLSFDTAYDAVEGFDKYVEGAASVICYTDAIQRLRAFTDQVRYRTSDEGLRERIDAVREMEDVSEQDKELRIREIMEKGQYSLSNFAVELDEYTNLLANKKSKYDRTVEGLAGRNAYNFMKAWENRVAANMVAVNPASWLTNFGVITQAGAQLKTTSVLKAMWQTLQSYKQSDGVVEQSDFLTNRRGSDPLVRSWQQGLSAKLSTPMDWIDTFSADTIVRARYMENLERGMSEETAMREADDFAANVMADRSKGATPTLFSARNPIFKLFTQFQLEVNNTFSYLFKDLPREQRKKGIGALAAALFKFLIGGFLYDELYEYLIGRRPMLDPIDILNDTVGDATGYELNNLVDAALGGGFIKETERQGVVGTARNLISSVLEEVPFVGNLAGGGKLPFANSLPSLTNIASAAASETATTEEKVKKIGKELLNPAAYWLLPFGGGQVKKMAQGILALKRGGSYTAGGNLQYPIYTDRKGDTVKAAARTLLFGKSATPEAQAWVEAGFGSLSEKATQTYEAMREAGVDQRDSYELIKAMSKVKKTDEASAAELKMQLLNAFDIEDAGKALYYYNMMASDKEKARIEELMGDGADMGEYLRFLTNAAGVIGMDDYLLCKQKQMQLERDENMKATEKAKEFRAWVNAQGYSAEQKSAILNSFKFYSIAPADSGAHSELYNAAREGTAEYAALREEAVAAEAAEGKTKIDAEAAVNGDMKRQIGQDFKDGVLDEEEATEMLMQYAGEDEDDVYWALREWKGGLDYKKYGAFLDAVDAGNGAGTKKAAQEYLSHGVDKSTLSNQLTSHFKNRYLEADTEERRRLKALYLSAYSAIGGTREKAIENMTNWVRDAKKGK